MQSAWSRWIGGMALVAFTVFASLARAGDPAVTFVELIKDVQHEEWRAWVTLDHEDWPIETVRSFLPQRLTWPEGGEMFHPLRAEQGFASGLERDVRTRKLNHPFSHFVNKFVVVAQNLHADGSPSTPPEVIATRWIETPDVGGWPRKILHTGIHVPVGTTQLTFKAHCKIHGSGTRVVVIDLAKPKGDGYEVRAQELWPYTGRVSRARKHFRSGLVRELPDATW